jgi:hypothetical protein
MNCKEYKNLILLDSSGELTPGKKKILTDHVADCPECKKFAQSLARLSGTKPAQTSLPHPSVLVNIRQAAEDNLKKRVGLLWLPLPALRIAAVAAILIASAAILFNETTQNNAEIRIQDASTMLMLMTDENAENATIPTEYNLESLAKQIMEMEGFGDEDLLDENDVLSLFGAPDPTTTQSHNTPEPQAERYVQLHQHNPTPSNLHLKFLHNGNFWYLPA